MSQALTVDKAISFGELISAGLAGTDRFLDDPMHTQPLFLVTHLRTVNMCMSYVPQLVLTPCSDLTKLSAIVTRIQAQHLALIQRITLLFDRGNASAAPARISPPTDMIDSDRDVSMQSTDEAKRPEPSILNKQDFRLVYSSPAIRDPKQIDLFLLGEVHDMLPSQKLNGAFIRAQCGSEAILVFENYAFSKGEIKDKDERERILRHHHLTEARHTQWSIFGWDVDDSQKIGKAIYTMTRKMEALLSLQQLLEEEQKRIIEDLSIKVDELFLRLTAIRKNQGLAQMRFMEIERKRNALLLGSMPRRTQSMIRAIQQITQLRSQGKLKGRVFLIAGCYHLQTPAVHQNDDRFSLKPLYQALSHYSAAILRPSCTDSRY